MNTVTTHERTEATLLWLTYILYALFFTAPVGALLSGYMIWHYKNADSDLQHELAFYATHYQWLFRTFLMTIILSMMALGTIFYFFGYAIAAATVVWWIYRIARGMWDLAESRPADTQRSTS